MGSGNRLVQTPTGQWMNQSAYNTYMQDVWNPQQAFEASANVPIPGVTAPYGSGANIPRTPGILGGQVPVQPEVGVAPPQQPLPGPRNHMVQPPAMSGPYGQQAAQMAGLLAQPGAGGGYPSGLLGGKRPFRPGGGK
jgi:hypothetical protein